MAWKEALWLQPEGWNLHPSQLLITLLRFFGVGKGQIQRVN
jgi:hypothetical protein